MPDLIRPNLIRLLPLEEDERRRSPRYLVPDWELLVVGVALADAAGRRRSLTGRVRDLSESGLSLLLPTGEVCGELAERGRLLAVVLTLPSGVVRLRAGVAHCAGRQGRGGLLVGYLVGISIAEIDDDDHARLIEYIRERS